jgi:predicted transcriptional regulator
MEIKESISLMKALGDSSRLQIVNSLLEKPQYLEEIAQRLGLAVSTVSFHMKKLECAGLIRKEKEQYYVVFHINEKVFEKTLKEIISFENSYKTLQDDRIRSYRQKVISTYFLGGKLLRIPSQYKKRLIVLEEIMKIFEKNRIYLEKEIDSLIEEINEDYCAIRRYFIDERMMRRENGKYWVDSDYVNTTGTDEPAFISMQENSKKNRRKKSMSSNTNKAEEKIKTEEAEEVKTEDVKAEEIKEEKIKTIDAQKRKEIIKNYKQMSTPMGVYQIKNLKNGKILVGSAKNLYARKNREMMSFSLKLCEIKELQEAWDELGDKGVVFEVVDTLEPKKDEPDYNYTKDLETLEELWLEKLQPYGERGYNELKVKRNKK